MKNRISIKLTGLLAAAAIYLAAGVSMAAPAQATLTVDVDKPGHAISPTLYGIFFEDINCSADGGIYPELVRNRNLEDSARPDHWSILSSGSAVVLITVDSSQPASARNPHALKVNIASVGSGRVGVVNSGYWGIALAKGQVYELSLLARAGAGFTGPLTLSLESNDGVVYAQESIPKLSADWKSYKFSLTANDTDPRARLVISTTKAGTFWLDMVSLMPKETWKNHGLRPDLANMLNGLKPAFVRFPGGCWVEGDTLATAYRWKQTIGDPAERRTQHNLWQYEATHGLGFHEYLQMCEDLGAEPLFVINCGMSHQEQREQPRSVQGVQEYVQDALDAIEYANGPVTSTWGAVRAKNGHPAPFNLKYMEIGNENGGPAYVARYGLFYDAIKAKYPQMHLIADEWSGRPDNRPIEIVDEHYYSSPEFFINNADRYDSYDRAGRKVYVGEYAVTQGCGQGNLRAAVGEAAFMTGLERNSDVVLMASYAPLFANVNYKKWNPDLIDFDSSRAYGIPSYYVQKMFSENRGDAVLPLNIALAAEATPPPPHGRIGVGTWATQAEFKDIKVTRNGQTLFAANFANGTQGWSLRNGDWKVQDGALRQNSTEENVRAFAGEKSWDNYTYTLKARKLGGNEGFLIPFLVQDEETKAWWNLGGWGNVRHGLELEGVSAADVPGRIETGRWYDIRIELKGANIKCYLDNQLIHDVNYKQPNPLHAVASLAKASNELILKVVNSAADDRETEIKLNGVSKVAPSANAIVLTSASPNDENSLTEPTRVAPVTRTITLAGPSFTQVFPGNSVTVMRLKLQ